VTGIRIHHYVRINIHIRVKCIYIVVWRRAFHRSHSVISGRGGKRMTNEHAHTPVDLYYYYYYYCYYKFIHTHARTRALTHTHYTFIIYIIYIYYIGRGLFYTMAAVYAAPLTACGRRTIAARLALPFCRLVLFSFFLSSCIFRII